MSASWPNGRAGAGRLAGAHEAIEQRPDPRGLPAKSLCPREWGRDHYRDSAALLEDPKGRALFLLLAREEDGHVTFLKRSLDEWKTSGKVSARSAKSLLPSGIAWIEAAKQKAQQRPDKRTASGTELEAVKLALRYEVEASGFYRSLVATLPEGQRDLFAAFLVIEEGHVVLVQAQLDMVQGLGFWFDTMEFSLAAG